MPFSPMATGATPTPKLTHLLIQSSFTISFIPSLRIYKVPSIMTDSNNTTNVHCVIRGMGICTHKFSNMTDFVLQNDNLIRVVGDVLFLDQ